MTSIKIPASIISQIKELAAQTPEQEICGYAFFDEGFIQPMENLDPDSANHFQIDPDSHTAIADTFKSPVIYHTHYGDQMAGQLSDRDIIGSKAVKCPYLLVHTDYNHVDYFDPNNLNPYPLLDTPYPPSEIEFYLGWPWAFERSDCYALLRTYYQGRLGITLRDYPRGASPASVCDPEWNLYLDNYEKEGFRKLDSDEELKEHDVILMNLIGPNVHHCAIVTDPAKRIALHVTCNQGNDGELIPNLSELFVYGHHGYWVDRTRLIIRHETLD